MDPASIFEKAITDYTKAIGLEPSAAVIYGNRGNAYRPSANRRRSMPITRKRSDYKMASSITNFAISLTSMLPFARSISSAAALVLSVFTLPALAQDKVPATTEEARNAFETADTELNGVYRQWTEPDRTTVQAIAAIQQSQRLWIQYRDLNAAAYQTGQSSRKVTKDQYYYYAATVVTRSRINELKTLFLSD